MLLVRVPPATLSNGARASLTGPSQILAVARMNPVGGDSAIPPDQKLPCGQVRVCTASREARTACAGWLYGTRYTSWGKSSLLLFFSVDYVAAAVEYRHTRSALLATFHGVIAAKEPCAPKKRAAPSPPHSGTCGNSNGALLACTYARPGAQI